ncbi:MAG: hypothetical protein IJ747_09425 [Lachnospiraceae bacterium]|nr:hypothetical protein [Lachnospiraceae bacterium]
MGIVYKKFPANTYVMVMRDGNCVRKGKGLSVLYNTLRTSILLLPATAYDRAFAFDDLMTVDFQSVCVQGEVTFRIADYEQAVTMADFVFVPGSVVTLNGVQRQTSGNRNGSGMSGANSVGAEDKQTAAMNLLGRRINNMIKAIVIREVSNREIRSIVKQADEMAESIKRCLQENAEVAQLGVTVLTVNVLGITAKPETRKALEAAAREQILKEQDDAIYLRRNAAIEQERLIRENELNTEIKVAEKEKEKKEKEQEIKRRLMETELEMEKEERERRMQMEKEEREKRMQMEQNELEEKIKLEERNKEFVALETENERQRAEEQAYAVAAMMKAYENVDVDLIEACALARMEPGALMAKAFMELGENAGRIGTLNMTPDLLETIVKGKKA